MQLLLLLAAYLLVTAVLKSSLVLSKRTCCVLALGDPLSAVRRIAQVMPCDEPLYPPYRPVMVAQ